MKTQTCPGCSRQIGAGSPWCLPCEKRMPEQIQRNFALARRSLDAAVAAGTVWLGQHPHATERELEMLALAAQGMDNQQIAERLHVSINTIRGYWKDLTKRWGCSGRAHIVATAFQLGYLSIERRGVAA